MLIDQEIATLALYDQYGREGIVDRTPLWADSFTYGIFSQLPDNARVLDIGCGHGRLVPILDDLDITRAGYLGIDLSMPQIQLARKLWPDHAFEQGSLYDIGSRYPGRFHGFWCACVLMHVPRHRLVEALSSLRASLVLGAVGLLATPEGTGCIHNDNGMPLILHERHELEDALEHAGFVASFHMNTCMLLGSIVAV